MADVVKDALRQRFHAFYGTSARESGSTYLTAKVGLPSVAFGGLLDAPISPFQQPAHVSLEQDFLHDLAEESKWRLKFHSIFHQRLGASGLEVMVMAKTAEHSPHHAILKIVWEVEARNPTGVSDFEPEMPPAPGHFLSGADQARGYAGDGTSTWWRPYASQRFPTGQSSAVSAPLSP